MTSMVAQADTCIPSNCAPDATIAIIGFIGPPGAGKSTQCSMLQDKQKFRHLSIGALMREESNRPDCEHAVMIRANQVAGRVNPKELSIPLLSKNIQSAVETGTRRFVLDGFPRDLEQSDYFASKIQKLSLIILLECPEQVYLDRALSRGRFDDNPESMKGRLHTYNKSTSEVVAQFEDAGILERVKGDSDSDAVHEFICNILMRRGRS